MPPDGFEAEFYILILYNDRRGEYRDALDDPIDGLFSAGGRASIKRFSCVDN
jgi:hypothetical protein